MKTRMSHTECFEVAVRGKAVVGADPLRAYLLAQGCTRDQAEALLERKRKNPNLTGVTLAGQWVALVPPSPVEQTRLREMMVCGTPPQSRSDREFWTGRWEDEDMVTRRYRREVEAAGISTTGKFYSSQLARFPGDPEAFVSDRHDVQKLIESRPGWTCDGMVRAQGAPVDAPPTDVPLAHDILEGRVGVEMLKNPALAERPREEVTETVAGRATPHWKKKKR